MNFVTAESANYVMGLDNTVCGSRSGANAIAVWMILSAYGSTGGIEFCQKLLKLTDDFCKQLDSKNIAYYRNKYMNIVAIRSKFLTSEIAHKYHLVPNTHDKEVDWWKVVVMDHVTKSQLDQLFQDMIS